MLLAASVALGCESRTLIRIDVRGDQEFTGVTLKVIATHPDPRVRPDETDFQAVSFGMTRVYKAGVFLPSGMTGTLTITGKVLVGSCEKAMGVVQAPNVKDGEATPVVVLMVRITQASCIPVGDGGGSEGGAADGGGVDLSPLSDVFMDRPATGGSGGGTGGSGGAGGSAGAGGRGGTGGMAGAGGRGGVGGGGGSGGAGGAGGSGGSSGSGGRGGSGGGGAGGGGGTGGTGGAGGRGGTGGGGTGGGGTGGGGTGGGGTGGTGPCSPTVPCPAGYVCAGTLCVCAQTDLQACGNRQCGFTTNTCGQRVSCPNLCVGTTCCTAAGACSPPNAC
jgi:hypothetical protein